MQLESQVQELLELVAPLRREIGIVSGPFKPVFLAKKDGDDPKGWKEVAIDSAGEVVDFVDGRAAVPDDAGEMIDLAEVEGGEDAYVVLEIDGVADGQNVKRYIRIKGGSNTMVKVTGSASGGGKYSGVLWTTPTSNIAATGNLSEGEVGVSGDAVRIVNVREVGKSTHDLASSGFLPLIFPAVFLKVADDGVPVYAIDGLQWEDCA